MPVSGMLEIQVSKSGKSVFLIILCFEKLIMIRYLNSQISKLLLHWHHPPPLSFGWLRLCSGLASPFLSVCGYLQAAAAFLSRPNPGKFSAPGYSSTDFSNMSPHNGVSQSPLASSLTSNGYGEMQRLREELAASKAKLAQWEEGIHQARSVSSRCS